MDIRNLSVATVLLAIPSIAVAGPPSPLPEPETIALLGIGAAALVIARWLRKK